MRLLLGGLALLLALGGPVAAGDYASIELLGWSRDGRYYALGQHGVRDGSGLGYAERIILDRTTGRAALTVRRGGKGYEGEAGQQRAAGEVREASAPALQRLGITGTLSGAHLYQAGRVLPFMHTGWGHVHAHEEAAFTIRGQPYRLLVTQETNGYPYRETTRTRGRFTLTLFAPRRKPQVLARRQQFTPEYNHLIHSVWLSPDGRGLTAILAIWSVGFEGPDVRYRAVTALLD